MGSRSEIGVTMSDLVCVGCCWDRDRDVGSYFYPHPYSRMKVCRNKKTDTAVVERGAISGLVRLWCLVPGPLRAGKRNNDEEPGFSPGARFPRFRLAAWRERGCAVAMAVQAWCGLRVNSGSNRARLCGVVIVHDWDGWIVGQYEVCSRSAYRCRMEITPSKRLFSLSLV